MGIVAFAVLLRFGLVAALGAPPALWEYHDIATNILAGRGWVLDRVGIEYRSFYAGWPYVGATIVAYVGFPSGAAGMQAFQALFSGAGVLGVVLVGRRVFDSRVALLAALLAATHPALVYYDVKNLHPLGFDSAMLTGAVALVLAALVSEVRWVALLSGIAIGASILQRGSPALLILLAPVLLLRWGRGGKLGARVAGMLVGIGLMVLPVFARNTLIHGTPVFSTMTGELLWVGSAPMSSGSNYLPSGATVLSTIPPELAEAISGVSEMERNRLFAAAAAETILADPSAFGSRIFQKFVYFWTFAPQTGVSYPASYKAIYLLYYAAVVVLAGLGLWRWHQARELGPALFLIGGLFLAVSLTHAVLYFEMRHRWALEPLILIFSAAGLIGPPHSAIEEGS